MKNKSCFTIVELIVVIAVIGILMGISFGIMNYINKRSADAKTLAIINQLSLALDSYKAKYGFYPPAVNDKNGTPQAAYSYFWLDVTETNATGSNVKNSNNNFCQFIDYDAMLKNAVKGADLFESRYKVVDAYGNSIYYRVPGIFNRSGFDIGSLGSDGKIGSSDKTSGEDNFKQYFGLGDDITNFKRQ